MPTKKTNPSRKFIKKSKVVDEKQNTDIIENTKELMEKLPKTENTEEKINESVDTGSTPVIAPQESTEEVSSSISSVPPSSQETANEIKSIPEEQNSHSFEILPSTPNIGFDDSKETSQNIENVPKKSSIPVFLSYFVVLIVGILIGVLVMFLFNKPTEKKSSETQLPPTDIVSEPTVTPTTVAVELDKYNIKVLNGSTVKGEAGKLKSLLENEGYANISIGNAINSDFTDSLIMAKKEVDPVYLEKLQSFLSKIYILSSEEIQELEESDSSAVIITIGNKTSP